MRFASATDTVGAPLYETTDITTVTTYQGRPALLLVEHNVANGKPYLDSALVLRRGLAPVWEHFQYGVQRSTIDYDGARVRRTDAQGDSVVRRVDHTYDQPVFHFAELDWIVRSVPLKAGYRTIVPLYSEGDDALEKDTLSVEGRGPDGVWTVRFADPVIIGHYHISETTRLVVGREVERHAGGPHFKIVPE